MSICAKENNMDEDQFMQYVEKCYRVMEAKQAVFEEKYDLDQYPVYWGDEDSIVLRSRSDNTVKYEFKVIFIGTHTQDDRFIWSWADHSLSDSARERSAKIKQLCSITGLDQFEKPIIEMDPLNLEQVMPVVLDHLNAIACFIDKSREPLLFIAIMDPGVKKDMFSGGITSIVEEVTMSDPSKFMEEILVILKNSEKEKLEGMFHGINLPPKWFEMVAPEFMRLFGMELKGTIIDIGELEDYQLQALRMAPQDVQDSVKHAIKLDYVVPDSDQNESGSLAFPIYFVDGRYKILLVGG